MRGSDAREIGEGRMTRMRTTHEVRFPNYLDDVGSERRTLFHVPVVEDQSWAVGDCLLLFAALSFSPGKVGTLTNVRQVRLLAELDADLARLRAASRSEYLARWDALHPRLPSVDDPTVWRIEFRYAAWDSGFPASPKWSSAS